MKVSGNEWNARDVADFLQSVLVTARPANPDLDSPQPVKDVADLESFPSGTFGPPQRLRLVVGSHGQEFLVTIEQRY